MSGARLIAFLSLAFFCSPSYAQTFAGEMVTIPGGTATLGMDQSQYAGPPPFNAPRHTVTLSSFQIGACEVTNQQYVDFLNGALAAGLVEVRQETARGPDEGATLVYGSDAAPAVYSGQALINLSGTRVMKDHDDGDGDGDPFTGDIEPENPLNTVYIGYDAARAAGSRFYLKDPRSSADFDWVALTTYNDYTDETNRLDRSRTLNDYDAWPELADFPANMPTVAAVATWPATFIRWYGAKAFALYYGLDLPTEAEWEYAALGGAGHFYATSNGAVAGDGSSAVWNHAGANPALGHVLDVKTGSPNPYGLYNMAGNVWEWVDDWYAADFYSDATDPANTTDTGLKVRRGGAWNYHLFTLGSASRAWDEQFKGNDHFGFRVVDRTLLSPGGTEQGGTDAEADTAATAGGQGGDFDGDGSVGFSDFFLFADAFGGADPTYDLDQNGTVDFADFFILADFFKPEARDKLVALARRHLGLPVSSSLQPNYPNPFNSQTTIRYAVAAAGLVRLDIFDSGGQRVRSLYEAAVAPGAYQLNWDGRDDRGRQAAAGVYFTRLRTEGATHIAKMTLLK